MTFPGSGPRRRWIAVALICVAVWGLGLGSPSQAAEVSETAQKAKAILEQHCYVCHGEAGSADGGINFMLDRNRLVKRKKVLPGKSAESPLFRQVKTGSMPKDTEPLSKDEIETLKTWIDSGADDFNPPTKSRPFISPQEVLGFIRDDLRKLEKEDAEKLMYYRYFTIADLYNAGLSDDELESYRVALAKLANSLSWKKRIVIPTPIDPAKTVMRINLSDYRWSPKTWSRILTHYPYGVKSTSAALQFCYTATQTEVPMIRADWFVAKAAVPPLYHELLELPNSVHELELLLRVDVAHNIESGEAARAAFNGSGVSSHNRLIERHDCDLTGGAYWKSYDFGDDKGHKNIFTWPLGPGGERGFEHDGGELIFNLPNGLQAYLLVDDKGLRIDKGPISVVSDPRRPDKQVVNGLSCMSCHAEGLKRKSDEVRAAVLANPKAFSSTEVAQVKKLYKTKEEFEKLLEKDSELFTKAVAATGGKASGDEPIVMLALRFEEEMDADLAAAEVGMTTAQLMKGLEKSALLGRMLPNLKVPGGTIKRDVFVTAFPEMVDELMSGSFVTTTIHDRIEPGLTTTSVSPLKPATATAPNRNAAPGNANEKVLSANDAPLANPFRRRESHPWFELSNIRAGKSLREAMDVDYAFEGKWTGRIALIVKTDGRQYRFAVQPDALKQRTGTLHCAEETRAGWNSWTSPPVTPTRVPYSSKSRFGPSIRSSSPSVSAPPPESGPELKFGADIEVYVELTEATGTESQMFKVSKSATRGKVANITFAREMRAPELQAYETRLKKTGPPPPPPKGTTLATQTTPLVPGTPVLGAFEGDWLVAEVLLVFKESSDPRNNTATRYFQYLPKGWVGQWGPSEFVILHWPQRGHAGNQVVIRAHVAVADDVLKKLKSDPKSFAPSVELALGSLTPPQEGFVVVPDNVKLHPGTPVQLMGAEQTVVKDESTEVSAVSDSGFVHETKLPRRQFTIAKSTLKDLEKPASEKTFAERLKTIESKNPLKAHREHAAAVMAGAEPNATGFPKRFTPARQYPITLELPKNAVKVTQETPLEAGTKLKVEWARTWSDATVVSLPENGGVEIKWEGWSTVEVVARECFIIDKAVLAKLEANAKKTTKSDKPTMPDDKPTTSEESTGKFKLVLAAPGTKKIAVIKLVMEITGLDLTDAKELVDSTPFEIKGNLSKADAEKWQKKLTDAGASAEIEAAKADAEKEK